MTSFSPYEPNQDRLSPNRNLSPITTEIDEKNRLNVGGCLLSNLADRYGTPLYVLDEITIRTACHAFKNALQRHYEGPSLPLYASKANSSLVMSSLISSEGFGLDAVSEGELITALKGGVKGQQIVLHGNNKSDEELLLAYQNKVTIVVDNQHDLDRLRILVPKGALPARIMLRFTPGIECHTHEYIKTGLLDSKFGFDPDQLKHILKELKICNWVQLKGLHAHIGSQIFELDPHADLADVMANALQLARELGHSVEDLNVGGGLGIRYLDSDDPPSMESWVKTIAQSITKACHSRNLKLPRLLIEPGRSLVGTAGITLYRVGARKTIPGIRTYLSIDGGMSDNPRPITYQSLYTACLADKPLLPNTEKVTIAGKHCESGDILIKEISLPKTQVGDVLVVFSTGAYNSSMSSNYNRIPRPASVIVHNGQSELVQRRETSSDLLRHDVLPERFLEVG